MNFEIGGPVQLPSDPQLQGVYLAERVQQFYFALKSLEEALFRFRAAAPAKPREGDLAAADGTNWDPGAGKGLYQYASSLWVPLGIKQPSWTDLNLENSWVAYGAGHYTPSYFKDERGWVFLRGTAKDGTFAAGTALFTLPTGYRPVNNLSWIVPCDATGAYARILLDSLGVARLQNASGNSFLYLNQVFFRADV